MGETGYLRIRNWDKWQNYRKDRGVPPWIKVHRRLLLDPNWITLTDAQRGQLVSIWMLAAEDGGTISATVEEIIIICRLSSPLDLQVFADKGFIELDNHLTTTCQPDVRPEERREEENRKQSGAKAPYAFVGKVIRLNQSDFDTWKASFLFVDLLPYLVARDEFLAGLEPNDNRRTKWMVSTASDLRNKNADAKAKRKPPTIGPQFKPEKEITQPSLEDREAQVARLLKRTARRHDAMS